MKTMTNIVTEEEICKKCPNNLISSMFHCRNSRQISEININVCYFIYSGLYKR